MRKKESLKISALWCPDSAGSIQGFGIKVTRSLLTGLLFLDVSNLYSFSFLKDVYQELGPFYLEKLYQKNLYGLFCRMEIEERSIWQLRNFVINPTRLIELISTDPFPPQLPLAWDEETNAWVATIEKKCSFN